MSFPYVQSSHLLRWIFPLLCTTSYAVDTLKEISVQSFALEGTQTAVSYSPFSTGLWLISQDAPGATAYFINADSPTNPTETPLSNLTVPPNNPPTPHANADRLWVWCNRAEQPCVYLVTANDLSHPSFQYLTSFTSDSWCRYEFNPAATAGLLWDINSTPSTTI